MANPASASFDGGVSGATAGVAGGDTALRNSVAKTYKNAPASGVVSETKNLRFAYPAVECDAPARSRAAGGGGGGG